MSLGILTGEWDEQGETNKGKATHDVAHEDKSAEVVDLARRSMSGRCTQGGGNDISSGKAHRTSSSDLVVGYSSRKILWNVASALTTE